MGSRDEERLVRDLFRGYNKLIRPVENMTQKVEVAFGLAFIQLINVVSSFSSFLGQNFFILVRTLVRTLVGTFSFVTTLVSLANFHPLAVCICKRGSHSSQPAN